MKVACPVWWGLRQDRFLRKKYGVMILPNKQKTSGRDSRSPEKLTFHRIEW